MRHRDNHSRLFNTAKHSLVAGLLCLSLPFSAPLMAQTENLTPSNIARLAAYEGNPEAQFKLALSYSQNQPNYAQAAYWYKQAARQGMPNAQYNLGHFYLQGLGVQQDTAKTIQWWQQAAHQNYPPAQHNIGTAYFEGIGVEQNTPLAKQWFARCAELGSTACKESLSIVNDYAAPIAQNKTQPVTHQNSKTPNTEPNTEPNTMVLEIPVHIQANSTSAVITTLTSKEDFTALKTKDRWQQIQLHKPVPVWCYKRFVSITPQGLGKLTGDKVRARTAPSTKQSKIITELSKGTELKVLQETEQWVQLALPNHIAWTPAHVIDSANNTAKTAIADQNAGKQINDPAVSTKAVVASETTQENTQETTPQIAAPKKLQHRYAFLDRRSDDDWLFQANPEQYTLLLGNFDNSKALNQFAQQQQLTKNTNIHILLAKRAEIEWKYVLYGNFASEQTAITTARENNFSGAYIARIGNIQEQRCSAWKTTIPSPKKLSSYCLKKQL